MTKYLIPLLTSSIFTWFIYPAWGQENTNPEITFTCENKDSIPITVAKNKQGKTQTIFYWKEEAIALMSIKQSSSDFCDRVTEKFNEYAVDGHNLSSFTLQSYAQYGLSFVCASTSNSCEKDLFTALESENQSGIILAEEILAIIIDPNIPYKDLAPSDAVVPGYRVNLFETE